VIHETADPEVIVVEQDVTGTAATTGRDFTLPNIVVLESVTGHCCVRGDRLRAARVAP
jgi:hypothetical protein